MKIVIDIGHPAHVNLFKNLINELKERGYYPLLTVREILAAKELRALDNIPYIIIGSKHDSIRDKFVNFSRYEKTSKPFLFKIAKLSFKIYREF